MFAAEAIKQLLAQITAAPRHCDGRERPKGLLRHPATTSRRPKPRGTSASASRLRTHLALLVVEEIGYLRVTRGGAILFFQLINRRHKHVLDGAHLRGEILHDEVMAAALLDRLLHRCHIVKIRGNSYRLRRHMELYQSHPSRPRPGPSPQDYAQSEETES